MKCFEANQVKVKLKQGSYDLVLLLKNIKNAAAVFCSSWRCDVLEMFLNCQKHDWTTYVTCSSDER